MELLFVLVVFYFALELFGVLIGSLLGTILSSSALFISSVVTIWLGFKMGLPGFLIGVIATFLVYLCRSNKKGSRIEANNSWESSYNTQPTYKKLIDLGK